MARAMVRGWAAAGAGATEQMVVSDRGSGRARALADAYGVDATTDNRELVDRSDVVVVCVKPTDVEDVVRQVSDHVGPDTLVASVAAGVHAATLENLLDDGVPVLRLMPNVPVEVGAGTITYATGRVRTDLTEAALSCLGQLGTLVELREPLFDAATALSGSGPAFFALVVEAFEDAAIVAGLSAEVGRELALTTMVGTARMLVEDDLSCGALRRMVTSPGGTAATGLAHMERAAVRGAIIDAVVAARDRAGELG